MNESMNERLARDNNGRLEGVMGKEFFATPNTMDSLQPKSPESLQHEMEVSRPGRSKPANLRDQVSNSHNWLTPTAKEGKEDILKFKERMKKYRNGTSIPNLATQVHNSHSWPTPSCRDYKGPNIKSYVEHGGGKKGEQLNNAIRQKEGAGRLNPDWVEALMGWPRGWAGLEIMLEMNWDLNWSKWEPDIPRVTPKGKDRINRLKAIGNGQVPLCVAVAWKLLTT